MCLAGLGVWASDVGYCIFIIIETAIDILLDETIIRCEVVITFNICIIKFLYIFVLTGIFF